MPIRLHIPVTKCLFDDEDAAALRIPLETGWVVQGPFVERFESVFGSFTGVRYCVATTSCTTALHVAVAALGLKPGDEVIVPAYTWVATANCVEYMGARPVFCDIDATTFNLDIRHAESLVNARTVGIIPVHLFGLCADMDAVITLANRHSLWIVEDAACGLGAYYHGTHAGTFGDAGCFSFHPRKAITTGEGGMLTTRRKDVYGLAKSLRDHGAAVSNSSSEVSNAIPDYPNLGYNYRMTDIQGALGCAQMAKASRILDERAKRAALYGEMLASIDWLVPPQVPDGYCHAYQAYVCWFRPRGALARDQLSASQRLTEVLMHLQSEGISTRQGTHAPPFLKYYASKYGHHPREFPVAYDASRLTITLPLYPQMTDGEQESVVECLRAAYDRT